MTHQESPDKATIATQTYYEVLRIFRAEFFELKNLEYLTMVKYAFRTLLLFDDTKTTQDSIWTLTVE